jgi:methylenetetrahydrofolate dehydrogenase (NADP+)/methenyltetrahydrofolate cyclohydrolase
MDPKIIDGRKLAKAHEEKLAQKIKKLKAKPKIVSFLVGDDPSSVLYSNLKQKKAVELGIGFELLHFPESINFKEIKNKIEKLNNDRSITGIMIQLPLPDKFLRSHQAEKLLETIDFKKDVDGLKKNSLCLPAVVEAILSIIKDENIKVVNKKCVVIGASDLVGKPVAQELEKLGATVDVCDSKTDSLKEKTLGADIIVSATGVPGLVKGDMVKEGVAIIDVGAEKVNGKVVGDVDFESVYPKAAKITPVPGGVGPMTVISLMENIVKLVTYGNV